MPSVTPRDNREMLLGVELTVLGGFLTTWGLVASFMPLVLFGVPLVLFGFWVTVATYANGADPRRDARQAGGAESEPPER
jgi:membrane protein implicated in regulation of membrane protease activity